MKHRVLAVVLLVLGTAAGGGTLLATSASGQAAAAGPQPSPASIKATLDSDGRQMIYEVKDKPVGPGAEMTAADKTQNVLNYCGDAIVDINPDDQTLTVSASMAGCYWSSITVRVQDPDLTRLVVVSDAYSGAGGARISGAAGDWTLTWDAANTVTGTSSVFSYAPVVTPTPTTSAPVPTPVTTVAADTTAPDTSFLKAPKLRVHKRAAVFRFRSSDQLQSFQCSIDNGTWKRCSSPVTKKFTPGKHVFAVRAVDAAGNIDPTPAEVSWRFVPLRKK